MSYQVLQPSRSDLIEVRGVQYHCHVCGPEGDARVPTIFMLHGWMDVGASFQFVIDALTHQWRVIAPDWRGYGDSQWGPGDSYWFPDYLGDLDAILRRYSPHIAVNLLGHSMGGNVAALYAGVRPERVAKLINVEGFGMSVTVPDNAPKRYTRWLDELVEGTRFRDYASFDDLAGRLSRENPRLGSARAQFLARHWGREDDSGRVTLRGDPAHKRINPTQYQIAEAMACWRAVTAPTLWIEGAQTQTKQMMNITEDELITRRACFQSLRLARVADAGHMIHHDQPTVLAQLIEGFLL